jgi:prepilin-type N-terminal cleavage/methylation domain-containing protein
MAHMRRTGRRGFTIIEMAISLTILGLFAGMLVHSLQRMQGLSNASSARSQLQDSGERALKQIGLDLKRSGFVTQFGLPYPGIFLNGAAPAPHAHPPAQTLAQPGDPDFGPSREIIFLQPADADGDGIPDLDANGNLIWDPREFSYVVITGPDGVNYLERRIDGAQPRMIARNVERIDFEDSTLSGTVPLLCVRVRIFYRKVDQNGTMHMHSAESLVRLRNWIP